ncbi:hypothetical protein DEJ00_08455 [Curtobacterium sp. MCLR17_039]|uniref:helix-turn-helix domain-containing protein n=1 Tax=Curtobacterium sp. MCLR17_039 TaxID=2175624 RepID=UPI000DA8CB3C|nr:hypothetical protein DEJ00_08455 [Curtobacterium sp. MCLR17_039]
MLLGVYLVVLAVSANTLNETPQHVHRPAIRRKPVARVTAAMTDRMIRMYEAGKTSRAIAGKFGISRQSVILKLRRAGVTTRSKGGPQ